jgi:hypothetical protein
MQYVIVLSHVSHSGDGKLIGVYSSESEANAAVGRVRSQPGFKNEPEGFILDRYELNKDQWAEGFVIDRIEN